MRSSIITLLTDFGLKDSYVASMKGVILRINPQSTLIDITHQVSAHHIEEAAFVLASAYSTFPKGTIHLSVVDPGVGSSRKPVLLVTQNYFFIGPDNGLFTLATKKEKVKQAVALTNRKFFLSQVSATFHGRDIFAPVAAYLSLGVEPKAFGKRIESWATIPFPEPTFKEGKLVGEIIHVDGFGNLVSNIDQQQLSQFSKGCSFVVRTGGRTIQGLRKGYWEGKKNELISLFGSGGFLEVSIREGNAQKKLKAKKGDPVQIKFL